MRISSRCVAARERPQESFTQYKPTAASFALLERLRPPDPKVGEGGDDDDPLEAPPSSRPPPHPSDQRVGVGVGAPDAPQSLLEEVLSWRRTAAEARTSDDNDQKCPPLPPSHPRNRPRKVFPPHRDAHNKDISQLLGLAKVLVTFLIIQDVSCSEFPDRECCDNPLYKFDPPGSVDRGPVTFMPPRMTYSPPEVPDFPEFAPPEVPPIGFPGSGSGDIKTGGRSFGKGTLQFSDAFSRTFVCGRRAAVS